MRLPMIGLGLAVLAMPALAPRAAPAQTASSWSDLRCAETPLAFEGITRCQVRSTATPRSQGRSVEYFARGGPAQRAGRREIILWLLWFHDDWVYRPYDPALAESIIRAQILPALTGGASAWSALKSFGTTAFLTFEAGGRQCVGFDHGGPLRRPNNVEAPGHPWLLRGIVCERRASPFEQEEVEQILRSVRLRKGGYVDAFGAPWGDPAAPNVEAAAAAPAASPGKELAREGAAPLALSWEEVVPLASGTLTYADESRRGGGITFVIPDAEIRCTGFWKRLSGGPDTSELPAGTFALSCPRGDAASGTWRADTPTSGSGEGRDSLGRRISIRFGS